MTRCKRKLFTALILAGISMAVPLSTGAISFTFDYSYDNNSFFDDTRKQALSAAGSYYENKFADSLDAIEPSDFFTFQPAFTHPSQTIANCADENTQLYTDPDGDTHCLVIDQVNSIPENTLRIYAGAMDLGFYGENTGGIAASGVYSISGIDDLSAYENYKDYIKARGELGVLGTPPTDFAPWGGVLSFDTGTNWHIDLDPSTTEEMTGQVDFFSIAIHELGHILGVGQAPSWNAQITSGLFTGTETARINKGYVSLDPENGHWIEGTLSYVDGMLQEAGMDPTLTQGTRKYLTDLDFAGLDDIGWFTYLSRLKTPLRVNTQLNGPTEIDVPGFVFPDFSSPIAYSLDLDILNIAPYDILIDKVIVELLENDLLYDDLLIKHAIPTSLTIPGGTRTTFQSDPFFVSPSALNNAAGSIPFAFERTLEVFARTAMNYTDPFGSYRVPEPSSLALFMLGGAGILLTRISMNRKGKLACHKVT